MNKYHCYETSTKNYICTLYTYTDVLNLQLFLKEKGSDLFTQSVKMTKKNAKDIFENKDLSK